MSAIGISIRRTSIHELWLFLAVALPVLAALIATLPTVDLAYQLRAGADILAGRGIPATDTWTFTAAGRPWLDQQWLAQGFLAQAYQLTGWSGLAVLRAVLVGLMQWFLLVAIRRQAPSLLPRTAALLALGAFMVTAPALALRPQLFGMVFFAGALAVLAGRRERPGWWWLVPLLAALWANYHGSFILAPVLVGLAWLEDLHDRWPGARRTLATLLATMAATLLNPFGFDAWRYALNIAGNHEISARISEWQPPKVTDVPGALFWVSVIAVVVAVVVIARRRRSVPWPVILGLLVFAGLGAVAARGVAWWPAFAVVSLAGLLGRPAESSAASLPTEPRRRRESALNTAFVAALVVAGIALLPWWRATDPVLGAPAGLLGQAPAGITQALRDISTPADHVWNPQVWGSWLEFAVPVPSYAFDARIEVIPAQAWALGDRVERADGDWPQVLTGAGVTIVVTQGPPTAPLAAALASSSEWHSVHADADGAVWVRSDP